MSPFFSRKHLFLQPQPVGVFPLLTSSNGSRVNNCRKGKVKPLTIFGKMLHILDSDVFECNQNPNAILIFYRNC